MTVGNISQSNVADKKKKNYSFQPKKTHVNNFFDPHFKANILNLNISDDDPYSAEDIKNKIMALRPEIKITKLKINLIFFYEDDITKENVDKYNELKLQVSGDFYGVKDINLLIKLLLKSESENSSFILISTGSSFEKINDFCKKLKSIKYIIIYCMEVEKYKSLFASNKKVELVSDDINEINKRLEKKSMHLQDYDENKKNLIDHTPVISFYEYENYYYIYHKILSFFFKDDFSVLDFSDGYKEKIFHFIDENTNYNNIEKQRLKNIITNLKNSKNFLKESLRFYTDETNYIYIFNKTMRKIGEGLERLSFLFGPMYYSMVKYLKNHPYQALNRDITLYRTISINEYELNLYNMYVNKIICFPSFTSTSTKIKFSPTKNASDVNNPNNEEKIIILLELHYRYQFNNIYQGMFLDQNFSVHPEENEILLFPFTFIKVKQLIREYDNDLYSYKMECDILNRDRILEFGLKRGKKVVIKDDNIVTIG